MRLAIISDTHNNQPPLDQMPDADVLVHAGDLTMGGKMKELKLASEWLHTMKQKYKDIVVIAGNHDFVLQAFHSENAETELRMGLFSHVHYLRDSGVTIDGKYFYGMPWQPWFYDWAFNEQRGLKMKQYTDRIPMYTNVLVTHGPPRGILDHVWPNMYNKGGSVGCDELADRVLVVKPEVHAFGHIHCAYGEKEFNGTKFFNAAYVDEKYKPTNDPFVADI